MKSKALILSVILLITACKKNPGQDSTQKESDQTIGYAFVTAKAGLKIREKPTTESQSLTTIPSGNSLEILAEEQKEETIDSKKSKWYRVRWNKVVGYSFGAYLSTMNALATPTKGKPKLKAAAYSGGSGCDGVTYSEFSVKFKFTNGKATLTNESAASADCELKDPSSPVSYSAFYQNIKSGTFITKNDHILITFTKTADVYEESDLCRNPRKTVKENKVHEVVKLYPVICRENNKTTEGFIAPNLKGWSEMVWVPK